MCPLSSNWVQQDYERKSTGLVALAGPESFESQLITQACEYWKEGAEHSKLPSSVGEYGKPFLLSADNVASNSYPDKKTDKEGSGCYMSDDAEKKKLSHNANERQRRKNLNALYGKLRSLLPHSNVNRKKKVSNPAIVSAILKYVPQLRKEIKSLSRQRAQLLILRRISQQALTTAPASQMLTNKLHYPESPNVILTEVDIFAMGPTLLVTVHTAHAAPLLFSKLILLFEEERIDVMNTSTFISAGTAWHSIQVKAMESRWRLDTSALRLKILRLCEQKGGHFVQKDSDFFQTTKPKQDGMAINLTTLY